MQVYDGDRIVFGDRRILKKETLKQWQTLTLQDIQTHIDDLFNNRFDACIANGGDFFEI